MPFTKIAAVQEVPSGSAKQVTFNGRKLAVFNVGGTFYVLDDTCPHRGAPLSEGVVAGTEVTCPWHGAAFDLASGQHLCPPAQQGVRAYKVQVVADEVQIEM
jgi:nitrite reductase/ring-hydroxylating ferredoxin subunit